MRKRYVTSVMLTAAAVLWLSGCGSQPQAATRVPEATTAGTTVEEKMVSTADYIEYAESSEGADNADKILIAYFAVAENSDVDAVSSASVNVTNGEAKGLVRILAEDIQAETGGELFSIQTSVDYPGGIDELIDYAAGEQDENARPELTSHIENLDQYDTIFVGYPNWWYDMPMVMYSFFEEYDFTGKTIIPFNSHNGSRFSSTIAAIGELEPGATVIEDGFTVSQNGVPDAAGDIANWLDELGY